MVSELIDNREYRQQELKEIILDLHRGKSVEEVKERFRTLIKDIGATELAQLEQTLIEEGLPEEEVKRLCDVHVSVFREALDLQPSPETIPGHPVHTFRLENEAIAKLVSELRSLIDEIAGKDQVDQKLLQQWRELHQKLLEIEKHYSRKENILFPYLEKNGISGPPSVMWAIHDDIRAQLKQISALLNKDGELSIEELKTQIESVARPMLTAISEMVYKENNILLPMCLETLTEDEWKEILDQSDDIGYTLIAPEKEWQPVPDKKVEQTPTKAPEGYLEFETGMLTLEQIEAIFNTLPLDITFVDKDNTVRYFSMGAERIFTRTKAVIGRRVEHCHPPASVHVVTRIVEELRAGKRKSADFWIRKGGELIYIRYFPVRSAEGEFLGVLEVTQNVTDIQKLAGEKRLLDEEPNQ